jgi:hypothetical protein
VEKTRHFLLRTVQQRGLGVADVQEAGRLRREARHHGALHRVFEPNLKRAAAVALGRRLLRLLALLALLGGVAIRLRAALRGRASPQET